MPVDLTIRQLVEKLEKQYAAQTITREEIATQLIKPLFESNNLNFSDNARYIVNTLGRPGHALATGFNSIQQGPDVQNALRDVLDFWAASPDVELAKKLGLTPSAPSLESMKAAQSNPDVQAQGVAELLEALQSVPTTSKTAEGLAKNLKAISDIQRELLEEAGKILPGMAPENFSGAEKYKTDLPQEILPEQPTAARKPKGPR